MHKLILMLLIIQVVSVGSVFALDVSEFQKVNDKEQYYSEKHYNNEYSIKYESPGIDEITTIYICPGYLTEIEFPEAVDVQALGDPKMFMVDHEANTRYLTLSVNESFTGETDFKVRTKDRLYLFILKIAVDKEKHMHKVVIDQLLKTGNFNYLKGQELTVGQIYRAVNFYEQKDARPRNFTRKELDQEKVSGLFTAELKGVYTYREPHYLVLDVEFVNHSSQIIKLYPQYTYFLINGKKVMADIVQIGSSIAKNEIVGRHGTKKMMLILKNSYISKDNDFGLILNINHQNVTFTS